jgi:meiotic recombination protein SPO11
MPPTTKRQKLDKPLLAGTLNKVESLTKEIQATSSKPTLTLSDLNLPNAREVEDLNPGDVLDSIEELVTTSVQRIMRNEPFTFTLPTRTSSNQIYVKELDRIVVGDKTSVRSFSNVKQVKKVAVTTRVLELVHQVLTKEIHVTKRDLFYTDVKLFGDQKESDVVIEDCASMLGCMRDCLNVVASAKGLVVGRVNFRDDGDLIDCTRMGVGGKAIPPFMDKITDIQSDAKFILLVEKDAAFMRLSEDRFYRRFPCIIITGKGQPDIATRKFLRKLKMELKIPVLALVDSDPHGQMFNGCMLRLPPNCCVKVP